ncbi:natural killer cell receptor 2B4 isoform X2 [Sorex araneus]|uniref:natural killer cell receptor 2B4 isoform X2 n=1 Tax=Sorex araneus TaxID=42254 RepID=UPI0024333854|nr:natural killer cell receptor 2B4 isoform X2 [Sorex araneus]
MQTPSLALLLLLLGSPGRGTTATEVKGTSPVSSWCGNTNRSASNPVDHIVGFSGEPIWVHPPIPTTGADGVKWEVMLSRDCQQRRLVTWSHSDLRCDNWTQSHFKDRLDVLAQNFSILLKTALPQDSGLYCLEVTNKKGEPNKSNVFVTVRDRVRQPQLGVQSIVPNASWCHLVLNCSVPGANTVNLTWYRDESQLRWDPGPHTHLRQDVEANSTHVYICNASDAYSWAHSTFFLSPGCAAPQDTHTQPSLSLWLYLGVPLLVLILSVLTGVAGVALWRRGRGHSGAKEESGEQSPPGPACAQEHSLPEEGSTVYSKVQSRNRNQRQNQNQVSASTPQDSECTTLYALVQPSQKRPQGRTPGTPPSCTIYQEVGRGPPRAQNQARLSRKELRNFEVYC